MLDGEQNASFRDHFLEVPFDLSDVLFVTTANTTETIPRPLLDRMEVIELNSYTDEEKLQIAKRHLLPKELKRHGLARTQLKVSDGAIREMVALTPGSRECGCWSARWPPCAGRRMKLVEEHASLFPLQSGTWRNIWERPASTRSGGTRPAGGRS